MKIELLAPAGNFEKLNTALYFGADAVYFGGEYGLRAQAVFTAEDTAKAISTAHAAGKHAYITVNIFARNADFCELDAYLAALSEAGADGVIVSDLGIISRIRSQFPSLHVHISTQANTTNKYSAKFYEDLGAKRIVLARELSIDEIADIRAYLRPETELESFVHGAMCVSYSGRCLLSNYLTGRDSNHGNCAQPCRWAYSVKPLGREGGLEVAEDERGTYIFNSKDLMMISHLDELARAGVQSFKIEGRMKTSYYLATVINAYRRAIDGLKSGETASAALIDELEKVSNRGFTTGFYLDGGDSNIQQDLSFGEQKYDFCAVVLRVESGAVLVEMRNRFRVGDMLEIISPFGKLGRKIVVAHMRDEDGAAVEDAKFVQQKLWIYNLDIELHEGDYLRIGGAR